MLQQSILNTVKYFDVQEQCLTLLELHKYMLRTRPGQPACSLSEILDCLENDLTREIEEKEGFYFLAGRQELVEKRLQNNFYSIRRAKRRKKFLPFLRFIPFISGVTIGGSEARGISKAGSDVDLFILTQKNRIWMARVSISFFFHIFGVRRHGQKIIDRFCLNHYAQEGKLIETDHNIYTAVEYSSFIAVFGGDKVYEFHQRNLPWIKEYLLQPQIIRYQTPEPSWFKVVIERIFANPVGDLLEKFLGAMQKRKIKINDYIIVEKDELSFHPGSKGQQVMQKFNKVS